MSVKAVYTYDYPSKDRQQNFGDDMLVNVMWTNNRMFAAAACFRAPKAMAWSDFRSQLVDPWAGSDPDYDPSAATGWEIDGKAVDLASDTPLGDAGLVHKGLITFRT